ncbi:MAG: hypothetical protein ACRD4T_12700 [Candidatus Acidiferrales bacterium]
MNTVVQPGEIEHRSIVVIYDRSKGNIIHVHQSLTYRGGQHPDKKTLETDAMEALGQAREGKAPPNLAFLHVDPRNVRAGVEYKVDPRKRALVEIRKRGAKGPL